MTIAVVTATRLEYAAARKALPKSVRVVRAGIGLVRSPDRVDGIAISCGLAGALREDVPTGTVLIPRVVGRTDGTSIACDDELSQALAQTAGEMGFQVLVEPLLTSETFVSGSQRALWAQRGYAAVDMETGSIEADRLACVRVALDTPQREISPAWLHPARAVFRPSAWLDLPFLMKEAPRCAGIAAAVVAASLPLIRRRRPGDARS